MTEMKCKLSLEKNVLDLVGWETILNFVGSIGRRLNSPLQGAFGDHSTPSVESNKAHAASMSENLQL